MQWAVSFPASQDRSLKVGSQRSITGAHHYERVLIDESGSISARIRVRIVIWWRGLLASRCRRLSIRRPELAPPGTADHHIDLSVCAVADAFTQLLVEAAVIAAVVVG